jgi:accessory gene regulator B
LKKGEDTLITIDRVSSYLADSIHKHDPNTSPAVMRYILSALLNLFVTILLVLIVAGITGHFYDALISVWAFPILRNISGGMHFKSNTICNVVSSIFILLSIYLPVNYWNEGLIINIIAVVVLLINAPSGVQGTLNPKFYPLLKILSVFIVSSNFLFQSHILSVVFLIQALTTFRMAQKLADKIS